MSGTDFERAYRQAAQLVERELEGSFLEQGPQRELLEAMRYSLLAGGKRLRPVLTLKICQALCGDMEPALDYACAVEMLHTYSLIHDDLPCMDDDALRRGKPTCHKVYGECNAVMAGDALQAEAFRRTAASRRSAGPAANARACAILGQAAGALAGICAGQYLDMAGQGRQLDEGELTQIHLWKTAALLQAACLMGLAASPVEATPAQQDAVAVYARELGLAFQIRDDLLDRQSTTQALGKPVGSDVEQGKHTFAALYDPERCQQLVEAHSQQAKQAVASAFGEAGFLCWLADWLAGRGR